MVELNDVDARLTIIKTNVDARDEVIKAFNGYQSKIAYEVVPLTSIYIYHRQNSNLTSNSSAKTMKFVQNMAKSS